MENVRQYHLGLDWGTSATKIVLRDIGQSKAFVIILGDDRSNYRYPSTIALKDKRVYFGISAEAKRGDKAIIHDALKAKIFEGSSTEEYSQEEDLATLYLAHVISRALDIAEEHALRENAEALMGMTLGIPAEELQEAPLRVVYERIARTAYEMAVRIGVDTQGEKLESCMQVLQLAREQISLKKTGNYANWLRPELAAAMYWGLKSPTVQNGLFTCVDIGAWTTNASYFRIHHNDYQDKGGISFYGGACSPPGMIEMLRSVGSKMGKDFTELFGKEHCLFLKQYSNILDRFREDYLAVWREGFKKSYVKEKRQGAWDGKLNVMVVGGGSKIGRIRNMFHQTFPAHVDWSPPKAVPDLGIPTDLYNFPSEGILARTPFNGDSTFLLVAYGLSVNSRDFPKTTLAPDVEPILPEKRTRAFKSFDELGFDK